MRTAKRLTEAYNNAKVAYIDENSKYVFLSDCHRGAGSLADEFTRNENAYNYALKHYFNNGYTYVEAGDGDELWEHSKFANIKNAHHETFENIKRFYDDDRLILIYGNHNIYLKNQDYVRDNYYTYYDSYYETEHEFLYGIKPLEALVLKVKKTNQEILIVHGHQGDFLNDQFWFFTMLSLKYFWRFLHAFGIQNPASPVKNAEKRHKIEKNYKKWIKKNKMMLLCGHTHRIKYPKHNELPYFNMGCCVYPTRITAIEISDGNIQLVQWQTVPNHKGTLQVKREKIQGPEPIEKFDIR
ncbi:metallophosphoesterase family protein [Serpentinicella sp. ANB-PHB4]|uniref:metallophosphoesterase n=1 Tax=Serpentinicella sp. ANB-PHB4 TaxID=3074076 RepID=UPI00286778A5|nr:metallophosphoesterase [Serpentinicella sp. ANB-PHB4]MDR5658556.1 metallophosphoesterase family protein [Serpentinicella sp. ANB-PHB4]